ncbi:MAG: hypothetical protein RLZ32_275 [Gemmatimonadota bacterium]
MESFTHPMFIFEFGVSFGGAFVILGMMLWDLRKENRKAEEAARRAAAAAVPEVDAAVPPPGPPAPPDHP